MATKRLLNTTVLFVCYGHQESLAFGLTLADRQCIEHFASTCLSAGFSLFSDFMSLVNLCKVEYINTKCPNLMFLAVQAVYINSSLQQPSRSFY